MPYSVFSGISLSNSEKQGNNFLDHTKQRLAEDKRQPEIHLRSQAEQLHITGWLIVGYSLANQITAFELVY